MPLAPALLSTTTACLVASVIDWPSARASWSVALPAANGTMKVTGFSGYLVACAKALPSAVAASSAHAARRVIHVVIVRGLLELVIGSSNITLRVRAAAAADAAERAAATRAAETTATCRGCRGSARR